MFLLPWIWLGKHNLLLPSVSHQFPHRMWRQPLEKGTQRDERVTKPEGVQRGKRISEFSSTNAKFLFPYQEIPAYIL